MVEAKQRVTAIQLYQMVLKDLWMPGDTSMKYFRDKVHAMFTGYSAQTQTRFHMNLGIALLTIIPVICM